MFKNFFLIIEAILFEPLVQFLLCLPTKFLRGTLFVNTLDRIPNKIGFNMIWQETLIPQRVITMARFNVPFVLYVIVLNANGYVQKSKEFIFGGHFNGELDLAMDRIESVQDNYCQVFFYWSEQNVYLYIFYKFLV